MSLLPESFLLGVLLFAAKHSELSQMITIMIRRNQVLEKVSGFAKAGKWEGGQRWTHVVGLQGLLSGLYLCLPGYYTFMMQSWMMDKERESQMKGSN